MNDAVLIFIFQHRKYVLDAPLVKPEVSELDEGCLRPNDPCFYIAVNTDEPPTCVTDFFTIYLFIITFMLEWLSISIHHGLITFPDPWVSLP